ncbi:MAG: RNA polymerase sigma factor [Phycisphaerales bacterium]|nr:RNA polymerase sigma factor [Phycisphaerales bacterium]
MTYAIKPRSNAETSPGLKPGLSEKAALEEIRRRLLRFAVKLVWNRDDAEEIVQDAFKLAWSKGVKTSEPRFGPSLFRTVANLCLNHRRRRRPATLSECIELTHSLTPAKSAQDAEQLNQLRNAVDQLPDQQRLALVLRMMEQMDYGDIADVMQLSTSAVRAHVHLGRRRLAEWMTGHPQEEG